MTSTLEMELVSWPPCPCKGFLDNGDEVLVPMPDYPFLDGQCQLIGEMPCTMFVMKKLEWYPDLDDIKSKISSNTKRFIIVLINPNNPTGALSQRTLARYWNCSPNDLIIFADEIYDRMVMDGMSTHQ